MKLNELTPFKDHPIYKASREVKIDPDIRDPYYGLDHFQQLLFKYDFKKLGNGSYGATYEHPRYPYIFKVFGQDPAYLTYLKYVRKHQNNPHVPKLFGKFIKISKEYYACRMEKLTNAYDHAEYRTFASLIHVNWNDIDEHRSLKMQEETPELYELLLDLKDLVEGGVNIHWDLHGGNIMGRHGTLVITDPFCT